MDETSRAVMCLQWAEGTHCYRRGRAKGRAASAVGHRVLSQLLLGWTQAARLGTGARDRVQGGAGTQLGWFLSPPQHTLPFQCRGFELTGKRAPTSWSQHKKGDRHLTPGTVTPDHASARCSCLHLEHVCGQSVPDLTHLDTSMPQGASHRAAPLLFLALLPANFKAAAHPHLPGAGTESFAVSLPP